ncbi:hypothetical protein CAOG_009683 [Capsaspora owczarzaki ATCC 30864]|uniref:Uncharacterized protein n=1 Tax=Capsaspora owczarzaki (strain ATCC 30864) TaxID=595528 RepID=A0A0D2WNF4_CAPO3|nr:hypothetical protein CAOG_009683 [Capsaspora owczarzaki ATCC 30864]
MSSTSSFLNVNLRGLACVIKSDFACAFRSRLVPATASKLQKGRQRVCELEEVCGEVGVKRSGCASKAPKKNVLREACPHMMHIAYRRCVQPRQHTCSSLNWSVVQGSQSVAGSIGKGGSHAR